MALEIWSGLDVSPIDLERHFCDKILPKVYRVFKNHGHFKNLQQFITKFGGQKCIGKYYSEEMFGFFMEEDTVFKVYIDGYKTIRIPLFCAIKNKDLCGYIMAIKLINTYTSVTYRFYPLEKLCGELLNLIFKNKFKLKTHIQFWKIIYFLTH